MNGLGLNKIADCRCGGKPNGIEKRMDYDSQGGGVVFWAITCPLCHEGVRNRFQDLIVRDWDNKQKGKER